MIKRQESVNAGEARCHLLGDLAARAAGERSPDLRQWAEIEQALAGRPGFWRSRWLVLALPALAGVALWVASGRTLSHVSTGCTLGPDGTFSVPYDRECTVTFGEGTHIALGKTASGRLQKLGFWRGAQLDLQSGHADLSVVHRLLGRWGVLAGPLRVRVTGTRFEVGWAPAQGRFSLGVSEGEVSVNGGPLRDRKVRAGRRLEVHTATGEVIEGDLGTPPDAQAAPVRPVAAESPEKTATGADAALARPAHAERKRGTTSRKIAARDPGSGATAMSPATQPEPPVAVLDPMARDWTASSAAEDEPAPALPGPRRLTVGRNGELVGGVTGPVQALSGSGTMLSKRARTSAKHLYLNDGALCTSGKMSQLACVDEAGLPKRCDWDTNWGVLIRWNTREDQKAWGSGANSSIALEFRGSAGRYRLVAHREGDPARRRSAWKTTDRGKR